jgi:hypothetical protein
MTSSVSDEDLLARQSALKRQARQLLTGLDLAALTADVGSCSSPAVSSPS